MSNSADPVQMILKDGNETFVYHKIFPKGGKATEKYIRPEMEVVKFEVEDVITTSGETCEYKNAGGFECEPVKFHCS